MATVFQSGTGSSAGHGAEQVNWSQFCVLSTSMTSTTEVGELKSLVSHMESCWNINNTGKNCVIFQNLYLSSREFWHFYCIIDCPAHIVTMCCTFTAQAKPIANVMHQETGSRCPLSIAPGLTILSAPPTWPPTTGAKRRCVNMFDVVVGWMWILAQVWYPKNWKRFYMQCVDTFIPSTSVYTQRLEEIFQTVWQRCLTFSVAL